MRTKRSSHSNHHTAKRPSSGPVQADSQLSVHDSLEDIREMNQQLAQSLEVSVKNRAHTPEKEPLWSDVDEETKEHHLGAGLNGRWF